MHLENIIRKALLSMHQHLSYATWFGREREVISLFVFSHLLPRAMEEPSLLDYAQIGIEVTVPQIPKDGHRRSRPDVCKDLVIWPSPGMTCWKSARDNILFPSVIMEWKTRNNTEPRSSLIDLERQHQQNVIWLAEFALRAPQTFEGYAVSLDLLPKPPVLRVVRITPSSQEEQWLVCN